MGSGKIGLSYTERGYMSESTPGLLNNLVPR